MGSGISVKPAASAKRLGAGNWPFGPFRGGDGAVTGSVWRQPPCTCQTSLGEKPANAEIIEATIDHGTGFGALAPMLIRQSATAGALTRWLNLRSDEVGSWLRASTSASASRYG